MGVVKALWNEQLLPRVISGASAGSLMAALIGTRNDEELRNILCGSDDCKAGTLSFRRDFFMPRADVDSPTGKQLQRLLPLWLRKYLDPLLGLLFDNKVVNLDTEHFKQVVYENMGDYTFQEAFDRTGRIINITVAPMNNYDPPRLLNYLTAPPICVWSAAAASCAVPGLFDPITLMVSVTYKF